MTADDRAHWDARYETAGPAPLDPVGLLTGATTLMVGISSARTERVSTWKIGGVVMSCIVLSAIVQGTI